MILIVGSEGSMGKRYKAILRYLNKPFWCVDKEATHTQVYELSKKSTGVIISSPTETHFDYLVLLEQMGKPILCEKPISKDKEKLRIILDLYQDKSLQMMMQYACYGLEKRQGLTLYDYFRTGNDGLYWDCIQPIGFSEGDLILRNESPIWNCMINGQVLDIKNMDKAYVDFVDDWLYDPKGDHGLIYEMHEKVLDAIKQGS